MVTQENSKKIRDNVWEIPISYQKGMRVPGRIYLDQDGIKNLEKGALDQVANVASLPGIQKFSIGLPDIHFGYGFSIGGVGAFSARTGVISPGGVGFDINCGVRMLRTNLTTSDVQPRIKEVVDTLFKNVRHFRGHARHGPQVREPGPGQPWQRGAQRRDDVPLPGLDGGCRLDYQGPERCEASKKVTYDFARLMEGATEIKCSQFGDNIIQHM